MILLSLNWDTIIENSISGLIGGLISGFIVGLFISYIGKSIWKKQFEYTNKREVFDELMPLLYEYYIQLLDYETPLFSKKIIQSLSVLKAEIFIKLHKFETFFGEGFKEEFNKMSEIEQSISNGNLYSIEEKNNKLQPIIKKFKSVSNKIRC
ncbi:hypothetical protein APF79_09575 [bacterium BRH_c32]|nr:MAG: hypothetical protein APF79_09575 [bacterium BRH_c32]